MSEIAQTESGEISTREKSIIAELTDKSIKIRVSANSYFIALFLATFFTGLFIYLEYDLVAAILFISSWILIPFLMWTDKISFDGKELIRTGFIPRAWAWFNNLKYRLKLDEIEQVETQALRALKRGGSVFYRYRTSVRGKDLSFVIASGGEDYRLMVVKLFPLLSENLLDNRSIELRDYLSEPKETLMKAEFAKIPSIEVLESSLSEFEHPKLKKRARKNPPVFEEAELEKADYLRRLANELRLSGQLLQALEVFRRALFLNPKDGWLLFEFARCLHSFAGTEKNTKLERKALAALRLAEKHGKNDKELLARLGESYFQYGDWNRAKKVFQKALDIAEESFRSVRGMAEISLREGKIAHVIHHFATANRLAETPALRRWTQAETDYFTRLNSDDEYMDMEISRVNLLESLERGKKTSLKISLFGLPWIIIGILLEENLIVNLGWTVSCVAILIWVGTIMSRNILSARIPLDME
ncbi:MAG: tetratricopeptide repeat protein [Aridibacter sp.]